MKNKKIHTVVELKKKIKYILLLEGVMNLIIYNWSLFIILFINETHYSFILIQYCFMKTHVTPFQSFYIDDWCIIILINFDIFKIAYLPILI